MYDVVIVGGGIVGASAALSLGQQQYKILLVEQNQAVVPETDFQARTLALSFASKHIYSTLGLWEVLCKQAVPIQKIMVSIYGQYGTCQLTPEQGYDALGYVVGQKALE